jgi:hypothetical protein
MNKMKKDILLLLFAPSICAAETAAAGASKTYQLDMFSLISFGLAIAALVLSLFMAWLSWQFYVKSTQATDKTNETVTKIETLVAGIQTNITEIVQRAVGYWIESGGGDGQVTQSKREVYEKLDELEKAIQNTNGATDTSGLLKEVSALKMQMDELGRGIRESQIKTLFPSIEPGAQVLKYSQETTNSDISEQAGVIRINVLKPTKIATAPIKFKPSFDVTPELTASLISSPYGDISEISAKPGAPGLRGCNIHLNSVTDLKVGEYVFEFLAKSP